VFALPRWYPDNWYWEKKVPATELGSGCPSCETQTAPVSCVCLCLCLFFTILQMERSKRHNSVLVNVEVEFQPGEPATC
jgi:hypothetical protein